MKPTTPLQFFNWILPTLICSGFFTWVPHFGLQVLVFSHDSAPAVWITKLGQKLLTVSSFILHRCSICVLYKQSPIVLLHQGWCFSPQLPSGQLPVRRHLCPPPATTGTPQQINQLGSITHPWQWHAQMEYWNHECWGFTSNIKHGESFATYIVNKNCAQYCSWIKMPSVLNAPQLQATTMGASHIVGCHPCELAQKNDRGGGTSKLQHQDWTWVPNTWFLWVCTLKKPVFGR